MKYSIVLKKCSDPVLSDRIAVEIGAWTKRSPDQVRAVLLRDGIIATDICVKRDADQETAGPFILKLMSIGAPVELHPENGATISLPVNQSAPVPTFNQPLPAPEYSDDDDDLIDEEEEFPDEEPSSVKESESPPTAATKLESVRPPVWTSPASETPKTPPVAAPVQKSSIGKTDDDDEEDLPGRILTDAELAQRIREQGSDYYKIIPDRRGKFIVTAGLFAGVVIGIWLSKAQFFEIKHETFFERLPAERTARFITGLETADQMKKKQAAAEEARKKAEPPKKKAPVTEKKPEPEKKPIAEEKPKEPPKQETEAERNQRRAASSENRKAFRAELSKKIGSTGLFAAIASGSGSGGTGSSLVGSGSLMAAIGTHSAPAGFADIASLKSGGASFAKKDDAKIPLISQQRGGASQGVAVEKTNVETVAETKLAASGTVSVTSGGKPEITGQGASSSSRSMEAVNLVITRQQSRLQKVYEEALKHEAGLGGRLVVKFVIAADGTVSNVAVQSSTLTSKTFENRILEYIKRWTFDPIEGGAPVEVTFPFIFSGS